MKAKTYITYQLVLEIQKPIRVQVGALGIFDFPAGLYVYTGSARKNLAQRIARHFKKEKPLRWHIDYLTTHPAVRILEVKKFTTHECNVNRKTKGSIVVPGFGASDCRKKCGAHLKYVKEL